MDKQYIRQHDVIHRYLLNKLTEDELNQFEIFLLENPGYLALVEEERQIQTAFKASGGLLNNSALPGFLVHWKPASAMAATLLLVVCVVLQTGRPALELQEPLILQTLRGQSSAVIQASGDPIVRLKIDMGPALSEHSAYRIRLLDSQGSLLEQGPPLRVDAEGWLNYRLQRQAPMNGLYTVEVLPADNDQSSKSFRIHFSTH